jgi:hypothetical protein
MPMQRSQCDASPIDRVRRQTERRALEQARRVPWKHSAEAVEECTDWQVFTLWLRSVVEAAGNIPAMVASEMESRTPQLLSRIRPAVEAAVKNGMARLPRFGTMPAAGRRPTSLSVRARAGWSEAVGCFSSMSPRSMKAWSHWEEIVRQWRAAAPQHFQTTNSGSVEFRPWAGCRIPGPFAAGVPPVELKRSLDASPQDTDPEIDPRFRPKFAECIPEHLLGFFARQRLYDWDAANHVLRSNIVDVTLRGTQADD